MDEQDIIDIAEEIICNSDGSFDIAYSEAYQNLAQEDKEAVNSLVFAEIDNCGCCGWNFRRDNLDIHEDCDSPVCWRCWNDLEDEKFERESQEEEDEEDDSSLE